MRIPAAIFCYWLGESEIVGKSILVDENSKRSGYNNQRIGIS